MSRSLSRPFWIALVLGCTGAGTPGAPAQSLRIAVVGDYGSASQQEADVAAIVQTWNPDVLITTGDNNYPAGAAATIDTNIGFYYRQFIFPYTGGYGTGDTVNRFFPSPGNHDWDTPGANPYFSYFTLPGNERYYDFVRGPVHFFALDSDPREPDGVDSLSVQGVWLRERLRSSTAKWKVVYFHHAPYSSSTTHGSSLFMRWPYRAWGASAVLSGHDHTYERVMLEGFPYIVNGLGGRSIYTFGTPVTGSVLRYNGNYGAQLGTADNDSLVLRFFSRTGLEIDRLVMTSPAPNLLAPPDGGFDLTLVPTLQWSGTLHAVRYHLQVSADSIFTSPPAADDENITGHSWQAGPLQPRTTYFWRVREGDGITFGAWSAVRHFATGDPPTFTEAVSPGWNLLSLPCEVPDGRPGILYPTAISPAYVFGPGGYSRADTLFQGRGFWLEFPPSVDSIRTAGIPHLTDTIDIVTGWNLFGTISLTLATPLVRTIPDGILDSPFYAYRGDYEEADSLRPGHGYWVKSRMPGRLVLALLR